MFKKFASDVMGLSDIGQIIDPENFNSVDSDDYIMHEDGEKIFFLIKSKTDEYCFTNKALVHLDGESAVSTKRVLKRHSYKNQIRNVYFETAGNIDKDVEIKFVIGDTSFSIDVDKKQIDRLKDLYKTLIEISSIQVDNHQLLSFSNDSLNLTANSLAGRGLETSESFKTINEYAFNWKKEAYKEYIRKDFSEVFDKYINN